MRRAAAVVAGGLAAAGLPVLAGWGAVAVSPPDEPRRAFPLLLALGAAPVVALLGALGAALWIPVRDRVRAAPLLAGAGALAALAGMLAGVYAHVLARARLAGGSGLPPLTLLFQVDDFARAVPLIPAGLLLGAALGGRAARRPAAAAALAGLAAGVGLGLGAGLATAIPVALASRVGGPVTVAAFGLAVLAVAVAAERAPDAAPPRLAPPPGRD